MGVHQNSVVYRDIKTQLDIPEDEPIFILRAQDQISNLTLMNYLAFAKRAGCGKPFIRQVVNVMQSFTDWRVKNPGKVKVPD